MIAWMLWGCAHRVAVSPLGEAEPALLALVEDARFVGLGESRHGSGGLAEVRNELTRMLVERGDVRALAVEAPWVQAEAAQRWLADCEGTRVFEGMGAAARGFVHPAFTDVASAEMLSWLCEHNRAHPEAPVRVFGFDNQDPGGAARLAELAGVAGLEAACPMGTSVDLEACDAFLDGLRLEGRWAEAVREGFRAWVHHLGGDEDGAQMRDDAMAGLLLAMADEVPMGRIALWAHDVHLVAAPVRARCLDLPLRPCVRRDLVGMGATLRASVGEAYRVFGLAAPTFEIWRRDGRSYVWRPPRRALERRVAAPAFVTFARPHMGLVGDVRAQLDEAFDAVLVIEGGRALLSLNDVRRLERGETITWRSRDPGAGEVMARALRAEGARAEMMVEEDGRWYVVTVRRLDP